MTGFAFFKKFGWLLVLLSLKGFTQITISGRISSTDGNDIQGASITATP